MNGPYGHQQRQQSGGMPGGQYQIPPQQSPSNVRHNSFGMPGQGGPQGQFSSHGPLHAQNQGMHPNMPQMHRQGSLGLPNQSRQMSMGNSMGIPGMQQHDQMRSSSTGGQFMNNPMGNMGMSNSMGMNNQMMPGTMNNSMGMNNQMSMGNAMGMAPQMGMGNQMGGSMMGNSMGNMPNMGQQMGNNSMNQQMNSNNNSMNSSSGGNSNSGINNGGWQSDKDTPHRREMIQHIVKMLKKDKNGTPEWLSKLPQMAKQLEVSLYRNARSFEAYMDMSTLKQRLQQIAVEVSRKARGQSGDSSQGGNSSRSSSQTPTFSSSANNNQQMRPGSAQGQNGASSPFMGGMPVPNQQQQSMNTSGRGSSFNMSNSSGMPNMQNMVNTMGGNNNFNQANNMSSSSGNNMPSSSGAGGSSNRNDPDWKVRIRHKQQRLLLLHHSAKCPHDDGRCPVTPHCADMKRLWRHMESCKDNNCRISHCFSSRAILSHYRKCKDPQCPACGPVRDTVRKSQNRNQQSSSSQRQGSSSGNPNMMPNMQNQNNFSGQSISPNVQQQRSPSANQASMPPPGMNGNNMQFNQMSSSSQQPNQFQSGSAPSGSNMYGPAGQPNPMSSSVSNYASNQRSGSSSGGNNGGRSDSEWTKIRHKQQRLLLLRHASRCQHEPSKCPVTPHCAAMKKLWEHIAHCKNQNCEVAHCMSSRYVLSHYRRCKDNKCPACGPVRETIRKSHEREKHRNNDPLSSGFGDQGSSNYQQQNKRMKLEQAAPDQMIPGQRRGSVAPGPAEVSSATADKKEGKPLAKVTEDRSLLNSFTVEQLTTHLASLNRASQLPPAKLKSECSAVLKGLQTHQHGWVFNAPVDPVELGLPDYFDVIKKPMDLGTVHKRLDAGQYHSIEDFKRDVNLTFDNAMTYNESGTVVYDMAKELKEKFEMDYEAMMIQLDEEDRERRQNDRACVLCGCEKLLFEPPVFFCNGMNCQSKRIRRNSHFYIGGNNQYFWCNQCYNELDDKIPIELIDMTIKKGDLTKKKNDETHEESWVQCDVCERWIHQICGLFNTRQNKEHHSEYSCPMCLLEKRKKEGNPPPKKPPGAEDLPRTKLSECLEKHVSKMIDQKVKQLAAEKSTTENCSMEKALKDFKAAGPVIIRQVTSMDRKLEVREKMKERYAHKKYPDEFPFRCKCIVVFQHIDGVDVVLFALYVYEHGEDNPAPNQRCVYISYLDSVHFMRPRKMRTFVYHEILIAYLDSARKRGYATAHIWACPPLKGDDYIFYAKPEDQKTPRDSRLRQWYIDMLVECQKRGIIGVVTNMYDLYFVDEKLDATVVPYLEGDYFPGEAENIIRTLEEGNSKKGGGAGKKKKQGNAKNNKTENKRGGTRSTGVDEEALLASGIMDKSLADLDRDQVMVEMGKVIEPMKESFIVAFLNWSGAKEEHKKVPDAIVKYREEHPEQVVPPLDEKETKEAKKEEQNEVKKEDEKEVKKEEDPKTEEKQEEEKPGEKQEESKKRDADGNIKKEETEKSKDESVALDSNGRPIKVIDDDTEDLDCEFLNNRQAFLNLCRGNHYQFDELRRAKHTSMMVLWHLHNRDAPKFVQQCVACNREILSGKRFHCNTCPDYDLCQTCYSDPKTDRGKCNHKLQAISVEAENGKDSSSSGLTEEQRKQRHRNLMLHIQLIEHAAKCRSPTCGSTNCAKMKNYLRHSSQCKTKVSGGCKICKRIWTLLRIHAQKCKDPACPIPQCIAIREKMRQLQKQQQAMDDRRRQEMNRHYRMGGMAAQS